MTSKKNLILISHEKHAGYHNELVNNPPKNVIYRISKKPLNADFDRFRFHCYIDKMNIPLHAYYWPVLYNNSFVMDLDHIYNPWLMDFYKFKRCFKGKLAYPPNKKEININNLKLAKKICSNNCKQILPF